MWWLMESLTSRATKNNKNFDDHKSREEKERKIRNKSERNSANLSKYLLQTYIIIESNLLSIRSYVRHLCCTIMSFMDRKLVTIYGGQKEILMRAFVHKVHFRLFFLRILLRSHLKNLFLRSVTRTILFFFLWNLKVLVSSYSFIYIRSTCGKSINF